MTNRPIIHVQELAALSRIRIPEEDVPKLSEDLASILGMIEQVQKIDVGDVAAEKGGLHNVMREDTNPIEPGTYSGALLDAAPKRTGEYVEVKQVLGHVKKNSA